MKYNKIYFMHIPKTGGRYILLNIIDPIREQLIDAGIEIINTKKTTHYNWHSKIDDKTYVITCLRDPILHTFSLYAHKNTTDSHGNLISNKEFNLIKNNFFNEIKSNALYENFQSKCFIMNELHSFPRQSYRIKIDEGLLEKRLSRVNLLLNNNNIDKKEIEIQEKIFLDLGINGTPKATQSNKVFYNPYSEYFCNKFSNAEKSSIGVYNKIDSHIYKNSNYFIP